MVINGRDPETLDATAREIAALGAGAVTPVVADLDTESGRDALVAACGAPDILVNNNGGPPPAASRIGITRPGSPPSSRTCSRL